MAAKQGNIQAELRFAILHSLLRSGKGLIFDELPDMILHWTTYDYGLGLTPALLSERNMSRALLDLKDAGLINKEYVAGYISIFKITATGWLELVAEERQYADKRVDNN